jgi:ribosomal protein S18 acetylase RimI-like enzyme
LGYGRDDWEALFDAPLAAAGREIVVIEQDSRPRGIAVLRRRFLFGDYLELLAVASDARHQGLGGALLRHVESLTFARSKNLFVCVSDFNAAGRRFYDRHGFREVGKLPNLLKAGCDEILLRKTIGPARDAREVKR